MEISFTKTLEELDSSTRAIKKAAAKRGIICEDILYYKDNSESEHEIYNLIYQDKHQQMDITLPAITNATSLICADNKIITQMLLEKYQLPSTQAKVFTDKGSAIRYFEQCDGPCVTKPMIGGGGEGVTVNIHSIEQLEEGIIYAKKYNDQFLVEKFFEGHDYRCLVVGQKLVAIAYRNPPSVIGDGQSTIQELIDAINSTREDNRKGPLSKIKIDNGMKNYLQKNNRSLTDKPKKDEKVIVRENANLFTGGHSVAVDIDNIHPSNKKYIEKLAKTMNLYVTGVDIVCKDLSQPLTENNGAIIEINTRPRIRMHETPHQGSPVNVSEKIIDMLFPETIDQSQPN